MAFAFFRTSCKNKTIIFQISRMNYNKLMFFEKQHKWQGTYLPRRVSASLTKLGPFFLAYVVFLTNSVIHTVLIDCKGPFPRGPILGSVLSSGSRLCTNSNSEVKLLSFHPYLAFTLTRLNTADNRVKDFLHPVYKGFFESLYNPSYTRVCAC